MTTAIAVYTSSGCVGRCDARCHEAVSPVCDCICGGRLHGVGARNALRLNTEHFSGGDLDGVRAEFRRKQLEAFAARHGYDPAGLRVDFAQEVLFS